MIVEISKGKQVTIPAKIRNELDLRIGSRMEISKKNHDIILTPLGDDLGKMFSEAKSTKPKHDLSPKEMDELNEALFR